MKKASPSCLRSMARGPTLRIRRKVLDVEDLLGIVAVAGIEDPRARGIGRQLVDEREIVGIRPHVAGHGAAHTRRLPVEGGLLEDLRSLRVGELAWHMYMRSIGDADRFSTCMAMSKRAWPERSVTLGRAT